MINKVFILENKKIKGIEEEKKKVEKFVESCGKIVEKDIKNVDLLITMGGDGTLIKGIHSLGKNNPLIYGIKYGKVGFLTNSNKNIEEKIKNIFDGKFYLSERCLIEVRIKSRTNIVKDICLNEVIFFRKEIRILSFSVESDKEKIFDFRGDGIIFSTPTGSTAHSLSAGGPVLSPELNAFLIIPVMPHLLTTRPVIVDGKICVKMKVNGEISAVVDGQKEYFVDEESEVEISLSKRKGRIILDNGKFFEKLSSKFFWSK